MSAPKIVKQFTRFVYSFSYDKTSSFLDEVCIEKTNGKSVKVFERFSQPATGLRCGLDELLSQNGGPSKIADCYRLNHACRTEFFLPKRHDEPLRFFARNDSNKAYDLIIPEVELFLFESGVGFISLEAVYSSDKIEDYINCNYFIAEIKSTKNHFVSTHYRWDENTKEKHTEECSFALKDLFAKIIGYVKGAKSLNKPVINTEQADTAELAAAKSESESDNNYDIFTDEKGTTYSYILLDKEPENMSDLLFLLRRNYKESYKVPNVYSQIKDDPYAKRMFENSYWSCSLNAVVNISYLVNDDVTDKFFTVDFPVKLHNTYFFLFINALHQRCAIMKFMGDMGTLDKLGLDYDTMKRQLKQSTAMHSDALNLKFRDFFSIPSSVEHVNIYYDLLQSSFCVDSLYACFSNDINTLKNLCDTYVTRIKERDEKIRKKRKVKVGIFVSLFGSLVAIASLINSYWSVLEKAFGKTFSFFSAPVIIAIGLIMVPFATVIIDTVEQVKDAKKISKDLMDEMEDNLVESDKDRKAAKKMHDRENKLMRKKERSNKDNRKAS